MKLEQELHQAMLGLYDEVGQAIGYWARRYLSAVKARGGLATAKTMLTPRSPSQRAGLDRLLDANRPDLTLEALVLKRRFAPLFTAGELAIARKRLGAYGASAAERQASRVTYPDELPGRRLPAGIWRQVRVNAYERNPEARRACLAHYGCECRVCRFSFLRRYGERGRDYIHVHHLLPVAEVGEDYSLDPIKDLLPVCPNCHAMLHRDPLMTPKQLRRLLK